MNYDEPSASGYMINGGVFVDSPPEGSNIPQRRGFVPYSVSGAWRSQSESGCVIQQEAVP